MNDSDHEEREGDEGVGSGRKGISLPDLADRLGRKSAEALFLRMDSELRRGRVIMGKTVRESRATFSQVQIPGHGAQLVLPGRSGKGSADADVSDGVLIIKLDDLEAVVKAGQEEFSWAEAFAPRQGLVAAASSPVLKKGSRGGRLLHG